MQQNESKNTFLCSPMVEGNPKTARIMVVAMSPGEEELDQGMPLVGPTGHMLWTWLNKAGVSRSQCYCVNTIGELPEGQGGKKITPEQYDKYWDDFNTYVAAFSGEVVIVLGGDALWRYTGLSGGIESWRGYVVKRTDCANSITRHKVVMGTYKSGPKKGTPKKERVKQAVSTGEWISPSVKVIIPTLHPSGVMRTGNTTLPVFVADINRAVRASKDTQFFLQNIVNGRVAEKYNTGQSVGAEGKLPIVVDVEGYDYVTHLGIKDEASHPFSMRFTEAAADRYKGFLADPEIVKIGHNLAFDVNKLRREGLEVVGPYRDTMLMAAMVEPDIPKGLKYVAPLYMDVERWDHKSEEDICLYNAHDVLVTGRLHSVLAGILYERNQLKLFDETIMPCLDTLIELSNVGLYVSEPRRIEWLKELQASLIKLQTEWSALVGDVNWSSPIAMRKYLKSLGMEVKYNKYGGETLDENAIRLLMIEHPAHTEMLQLLLELRGVKKDISTYADINLTSNNTVHPSFLPAGKDDDRYDMDGHKAGKGLAGTWRPTAKNPNIQNQHKRARNIYVPRTHGHVFVEMDYSSFEARILAQLSGDSDLLAAINDDLHGRNSTLLGVDRTRAKNGFYGWSYGAGARTLRNTFRSKGYDVSHKQCVELLAGFDRLYPKAAEYRNRCIQSARLSKFITNPFGLMRFFYATDPGTAPANTMIQSTAAIIMWKVLPKLAAEAKRQGGMMVAMVHDSVEFELPANFNPEPFRDIMEQEWPEIGPGFRVPIDIKVGPSWGEVVKI